MTTATGFIAPEGAVTVMLQRGSPLKLPLAAFAALATPLPLLAAELPRHVSGQALVIGGGGLKIEENEMRLFGIDAPEMRDCEEGLPEWRARPGSA